MSEIASESMSPVSELASESMSMSRRVFALPDLGEGLTEAELVRWLVQVGDTIAIDAPIAEVETAKAVVEVPSPFQGVIADLHGAEGSTIQVGAPLISVEEKSRPAIEERAGSGSVLIGYGTSVDSQSGRRRRRRRVAAQRHPATSAAAVAKPAVASPIVRKLARDRQIDITAITGSGPDGLITRWDVDRAASLRTTSVPQRSEKHSCAIDSDPAGGSSGPSGDGKRRTPDPRTTLAIRDVIPLKGIRKTIATSLTRSRTEIPEATTWVDVDATELLNLRTTLSDTGRRAPSLLAMVARFTAAGLRRFPELNAFVDVDRQEIVHLDGVNLGIAVQTDRGLLVPAVRDAHRCSARELDTEIRRVAQCAREGSLSASELSCGSFTLNNYGVLGVDGSVAIINFPEVAILGIGRVLERPWVVEGQITVRSILQLSLVFDHRVCDGGTAAGFLRFVADAVEAPAAAVVDL
jgi:2-oxoisovalerate dehydrogenase E2 component (dihydrolipoyl transacylase)